MEKGEGVRRATHLHAARLRVGFQLPTAADDAMTGFGRKLFHIPRSSSPLL